jgi:hypothetical protein
MKTIYEEIREIQDSNLPLEIKLCALWGLQNTKREAYVATQAFHDTLREAMPIGEPMRVKDIKERFNLPISIQKLTVELYNMQYFGELERKELPTGKTLKVMRDGHWGWDNEGNWKWHEYAEVEIEEKFAYYTRVR